MKRLSTGVLATLIAAAWAINAVAAPSNGHAGNTGNSIAQAGSPPPANFGTPPSGQIPILFNDHHVYAKPDVLKQGRVLAALVKNGTLLIPLRSMFEQMGATVSYDAGSKTATVSKAGSEVKVTVGKPEVLINGESRPLDVPPMMYEGNVLVPVRVISEGMGAYVQWVPDQRVVVVRYLPATPPPPPASAPPPPPPPPTPAPTPKPQYKDLFIAGDYIVGPKVYNEFSPGNTGHASYAVRGAFEFDLFNIPWMLEGNYEQWQYPHDCNGVSTTGAVDPQCLVSGVGGDYSTYVHAFTARDQNIEGRFGLRILQPRIYLGVGYLWRSTNYGYPNMEGVGVGLEKLPDLDQELTFFGSFYYYPTIKGNFSFPNIPSGSLEYELYKYQIGALYVIGKSPIFIEAGFMGNHLTNKQNAPSDITANGAFAGLGIKF